jgi:hypothetical protein
MNPKRFVFFILDIGADARDSEYVRLIKRIWYAATAASLPMSLLTALSEFLAGHTMLAAAFLFSFLLFLAVLADGARTPNHFERNTLIVLVFFVLAPAFITVSAGGIWRAGGGIMIGLLGPLFALMLPDKRWAFCLFGLYIALVLILTGIWPFPGDRAFLAAGFDQFQFWLGFVVLLAFVFGGLYFFVVQRDKAHRLLGLEKDKSESLLRRIEKDVEQAAEIQKRLLPARDPVLEGFDISGANIPCYQVGGDYYDFVPIDADRLGLVIADVSGKGISAALLMASLRAALLAEVHPGFDIERMAVRLSDFITFFFGELDRRTGELRYINAGHNPPFVARRTGGFAALSASGFPLGMFPGANYEPGTVRLDEGDTAVLFTDGITEARNGAREEYSEERLRGAVAGHPELTAREFCRAVLEEAYAFACATEPSDDITLVVVKRNPGLGSS